MCLRTNRNDLSKYENNNLISTNINKVIETSNNLTENKSVTPDNSTNLEISHFDTSSFKPNTMNFGISIFKPDKIPTVSNVDKKDSVSKIPNTIKINQPSLKDSKEYKLTKRESLKDGVESLTYKTSEKGLDIARVEITDPKKAKISILYKVGSEPIGNILKHKKATVLINGVFTDGSNAIGNIKGENLQNNKQDIYRLEGNKAATNGRAFFGITKDGKLEIKKGGNLEDDNNNKYSQLMSGLVILSDSKNNKFKNKDEFLNYMKKNNDKSSLINIFRANEKDLKDNSKLDTNKAPRTAIGITKDNKFITLTIGKGENRYGNVSDIYSAYKILDDLGAVSKALLDGGGATFKVLNGKLVEPPQESSGYGRIPSAILVE